MREGWIALHRSLTENPIWGSKPFSRGQAWIDLLLLANWKDEKVLIGGTMIDCKRGQSIRSLETWAKRWGWSKSAVRRYFGLLTLESMIVTENVQKTTRLTICNYERYQEVRNDSEPIMKQFRTNDETILAPNEQVNNETSEQEYIGAPQADAPSSPKQPKTKREQKTEYAADVRMAEEEYGKLVAQYGKESTDAFIEKLSTYKGATGKKYKSDYLAILNWVIDAVLNGRNGTQIMQRKSNGRTATPDPEQFAEFDRQFRERTGIGNGGAT
jgi:hypothetical protein